MGSYLKGFDITFCNLESPISDQGQPVPGKGIAFRSPLKAMETLRMGGFDVISFANNHALDYRDEAFGQTLSLLRQDGVKTVGAGENLTASRQPAVFEKNGVKVAFLAYTDMADLWFSSSYKRPYRADETRCGVAPLEEDLILEDIAAVKSSVDVVVVSLHWGVEYTSGPTDQQQKLAHDLIDAGANLIIGHHPHVFQGFEVYGGGLIAYSLGNFIFDQNQRLETRQGLLLETTLTPEGLKKVRVRPALIEQSQPQEPDGEMENAMLAQLQEYCDDLGTTTSVQNGYLEIILSQTEESSSKENS
jgi:poly-gamma-glutamate synthesis protein (capsule biosynthesis protein)